MQRQPNRLTKDIAALAGMPLAHRLRQTNGFWQTSAVLKTATAIFFLLQLTEFSRAEPPLQLSLPIKCSPGADCFVQNYVDQDPSEKAQDFRCGQQTYDGHNGTDIRVPDLQSQHAGVEVLAAASGVVGAIRDGVPDISVRTGGKSAIAGIECGNGVVIKHDNGWTTQYCHMAKGSVSVKAGQRVDVGQPLGLVGMSGNTEFPHVHFTVRLADKIIDPFAFGATPGSCRGGVALWTKSVSASLEYREGAVLNSGFANGPVTMESIESGDLRQASIASDASAIVAYVRSIGLKAGDIQTIRIQAPDGTLFSEYVAPALDRDKAQVFVSAGRKKSNNPWLPGEYQATYSVSRENREVLRKTFSIKL